LPTKEHEKSLLGAAFRDPAVLDGAAVTEELFEDKRNKLVLRTMRAVRDAGQPVTLMTVSDNLAGRIEEAGGTAYLASLSDFASSANASYYVQQLGEAARKRTLGHLQVRLGEELKDGRGSEDILAIIESELARIRMVAVESEAPDISTVLHEIITEAEKRAAAGTSGPSGVATGFPTLDRITGGLQAGAVYLIGARSSVGKTALALSMSDEQIRHGIKVAYASLEMSARQVVERLLCARAGISTTHLRFGRLVDEDFAALMRAAGQLQLVPFDVLDKPELTVRALRAWALSEVGKGARVLFVDYAGLLDPGDDGRPRWESMAIVSRSMKSLARELEIPLVVLCQLNRAAAESGEPGLHNLRDSGAFEQDADVVLLITRDTQDAGEGDTMPAKLLVAKNRSGPTGRVNLVFKKSITRFFEGFKEGSAP
jgi:replicative DNA helicase